MKKRKRINKYGNVPVLVAGKRIASQREAKRYIELTILHEHKQIQHLKTQVRYKLEINGILICTYIADFVYYDLANNLIVEDSKGYQTPEYKLKKKLMLAIHGIKIKET